MVVSFFITRVGLKLSHLSFPKKPVYSRALVEDPLAPASEKKQLPSRRYLRIFPELKAVICVPAVY